MSTPTLLNVKDPMRLFRQSFDKHILQPVLQQRLAIRQEHEQRERQTIINAQGAREHGIPTSL